MNPQQHYATHHHAPPQQQQQQQLYGRTSSAAFATVGAMGGMPGASTPLSSWSPPSPQEAQYFEMLFGLADEEKRHAIGGRIAVTFFSRSNLDKVLLREIWTIADSQQRSELSRNEFFVAMRLISMAQRGESMSAQRFVELASTPYPLPTLAGVPPPPPHMPPQAPAPPVQATPTQGAYALTDEEKQRYDGIFQQYDTDRDGFLNGGEAVQLFGMSGLDRGILREIWAMADRTQDSRLDVKEFYIAMHLIVCVSKRGLPMPTELPPDMAQSVFGGRSSFTSTTSLSLGSPAPPAPQSGSGSRTGSMMGSGSNFATTPPQADPAPAKHDAMDAFAASAQETVQPSRVDSFSRTSTGSGVSATGMPSTPSLSTHDMGMAGLSMEAPSPVPSSTSSATGSFGASMVHGLGGAMHAPPLTPSANVHESARERAGSTSSVSSFASVSTEASVSIASGLGHAAPSPMTGLAAMGSFHGSRTGSGVMMAQGPMEMPSSVPPPPPPPQTLPFLADEAEAAAVRNLDQSNEALVQALHSVEKKQHAIEALSNKLRDLDQLRHELVTLSMKRDSIRATSASAAPPPPTISAADSQAVRAVEQTLHELIESEKATIQKLQSDISRLESELTQTPAPMSAGLSGTVISPGSLPAPLLGESTPKSTFEAFDGFGSSSPAPEGDAFANFNFN